MILWFYVFFHPGCADSTSRVWQWDENTKVSNALGGRSGHWEVFEGKKLFEPVLEDCMTVFSSGSPSSFIRAREVGENEQGWASQIWRLKYLSGVILFSLVCNKHLFRSALIHTGRCFKTWCPIHVHSYDDTCLHSTKYQRDLMVISLHIKLCVCHHLISSPSDDSYGHLPSTSVVKRKFYILLVWCGKGRLVAVPQENRNAQWELLCS